MSDADTRMARYGESAVALHDHLEQKIDAEYGYPDEPSWGYAFSVLLSAAIGHGNLTELGEVALRHLERQDHEHANYSWEFVVYAIQQTKRHLKSELVLPCDKHRAKGTRMFNWFLLRQLNRGWFSNNSDWTLLKLRLAKHIYTDSNGMILDELHTRSLQYHAFCLFLICEIHKQYPRAGFLREWMYNGAMFSIDQMLSDGSSLWIGRGQEQIFGYGSLMYALEYVNQNIRPLPVNKLNLLQTYTLSFQRADGSFPLVLRRRDPESPDLNFSDKPSGWYGYNTLYDYQPFLAYTMWRTAQLRGARA